MQGISHRGSNPFPLRPIHPRCGCLRCSAAILSSIRCVESLISSAKKISRLSWFLRRSRPDLRSSPDRLSPIVRRSSSVRESMPLRRSLLDRRSLGRLSSMRMPPNYARLFMKSYFDCRSNWPRQLTDQLPSPLLRYRRLPETVKIRGYFCPTLTAAASRLCAVSMQRALVAVASASACRRRDSQYARSRKFR